MIIHFFQPELFNRTEQKTNPFFDPLIDVCRKNNIPYRVFISEKKASPNGYRNAAGNSWILVWPEILGFRLIKWFHLPSRLVWRSLGAVMNILTFGRYRADICITVAGVHMEILQGIAPRARLVDLQHGVIFPYHTGYFDKTGKLLPRLAENPQREYWLYGSGFRDVFFFNPQNRHFLASRVFIVGDLSGEKSVSFSTHKFSPNCNKLAISLQFKPDMGDDVNLDLKKSLRSFLENHQKLFADSGVQVFLRHHPRYCNCIDLTDVFADFPNLKSQQSRQARDMDQVFCHVTWTSTTVFEYAEAGIPTLFLSVASLYDNGIFSKCYHYPYENTCREIMEMPEEELKSYSEVLHSWYQQYYQPFDCRNVMELFRINQKTGD